MGPSVPGYRILNLLGEGGMGAVYLAEDATLNRRVALKVLSSRVAADPDSRERFLREARSMASVEHPHIVRVYTFGEHEGTAYIVMEYIKGETLADRIARGGRLAIDETLRIVGQVAEGLEAAWERGIVHRDIKPSNILIDKRDQIHVADFGLAKPVEVDDQSPITRTGLMLGTPHYLSPEQARGQKLDFRSDIYSLGILLYEMLTGQQPFRAATPVAVIAQHLNEALPPLPENRPDTPAGVVRLVESMTEKDPAARPGSYDEIRQELRGGQPETAEARAATAASTPGPWHHWLRRAAAIAGAIALGSLPFLPLLIGNSQSSPTGSSAPEPTERFTIAVAPFYGPNQEAAREGKTLAVLVERAIHDRFNPGEVTLVGHDQTEEPVRDHDAARGLGEGLGANVVFWGQVVTVGDEAEFRPAFTPVGTWAYSIERKALSQLEEGTMAVSLSGAAPDPIEQRKTPAAVMGEMALRVAGHYALYAQDNAQWALALFKRTPVSLETLVDRAMALSRLRGSDGFPAERTHQEALNLLHQAAELEPGSAQVHAAIGDLHVEADDLGRAIEAYERADSLGTPFTSRLGVFTNGKLVLRDVMASAAEASHRTLTSQYLVVIDPVTLRVVHRRYVGRAGPLEPREGGWVHVGTGEAALQFVRVKSRGQALAELIVEPPPSTRPEIWREEGSRAFIPRLKKRYDVRTFLHPAFELGLEPPADGSGVPFFWVYHTPTELETGLEEAAVQDATEPWPILFLGRLQWLTGDEEGARATWQTLFSNRFSSASPHDFAVIAARLEQFDQPSLADRAVLRAFQRWRRGATRVCGLEDITRHRAWRRELREALAKGYATSDDVRASGLRREEELIRELDGMVPCYAASLDAVQRGAPFLPVADRGQGDRAHQWLARARLLAGIPRDAVLASSLWSRYWRERGENHLAEIEETVLASGRGQLGLLVLADSSFWLALATGTGYAVLLLLLTLKAALVGWGASGWRRKPSAAIASVSSDERRLLVVTYLVAATTILLVPVVLQLLRESFTVASILESIREPYVQSQAAIRTFLMVAGGWSGAAFIAFCFFRPRRTVDEAVSASGLVGRVSRGLGFLAFPGAFDLFRGTTARAYVTFCLTVFAVWLWTWQTLLPKPAIGERTYMALYELSEVPLPTLPEIPVESNPLPALRVVSDEYWWDLLFAFPGLAAFWAVAAILTVAAVWLHVSRWPRIWRFVRAGSG